MTGEVTFLTEQGEEKATIDVEVAADPLSRHNGLSNREELPMGEGMLFMYQDEDHRTFVMRNMNFDLDIIFIDAEGEITEIHEASVPAEGQTDRTLTEYDGLAQAVVEVPVGYCLEAGVSVGDFVDVLLYE